MPEEEREEQDSKANFIAYPKPLEGPKTPYKHVLGTNPVLTGLPLAIAGSAVASLSPLAGFFWSNAGFSDLQKIGQELVDHEPRYDPTVIPTGGASNGGGGGDTDAYEHMLRHLPYSRSAAFSGNTTVGDYHAAYRAGETTPGKVAEVILRLVEKDARCKTSFVSVKREKVLAAAEASTRRFQSGEVRGLLDGVPVAIKDEVDLEGHPKRLGTTQDFSDPKDATIWCVRKWEEAGAIVFGKLAMHEFGLDTTGNNPNTGTPQNPHNANYYPGGSSSASATTVACNLLPLTLGCDGGGSIRIPSAYCGIYGLKPSHGRVGYSPSSSLAFSNTVIGPMAGNMADLELGYRVMAAPDPAGAASALFAPPVPRSVSSGPKVIGICKPWLEAGAPVVLDLYDKAISHYRSKGYETINVDLPYIREGQLAHAMTILAEAGTGASDIHQFTPSNKILLSVAAHTPARDFLFAQKLRNLWMKHLSHLFAKNPGLLIVTPTTPNAGWPINSAGELNRGLSDANMSVWSMTYVWLANFAGCPAINIPIGRAEGKKGAGKVPVGLMAMGEWGDEERLLEFGKVGERWVWDERGGELGIERPEECFDILQLAK